jgi:hypothetical protein
MERLATAAREELEAAHRSYRMELVPLNNPGEVILVTGQRRSRR